MNKKNVKFLSIFFLWIITVPFFIPFGIFAQNTSKAKIPLEVQYPTFPGVPAPPKSGTTDITRYLLYIYGVVVALSGIVVFITLVHGGFKYLTSAGNPSKMSDAKDQIFSGLIGMGIVLSSFIILNLINPELTNVTPPMPPAIGRGIILYTDQDCGNGANAHPGIVEDRPPPDVEYIRIEGSRPLPEVMEIQSIYSFHNAGEEGLIAGLIEIDLYDNISGQGNPSLKITRNTQPSIQKGCLRLAQPIKVGYVRLKWFLPGVWLFNYPNGDPISPEVGEGKNYAVYQVDQASLPEFLKGKVKSIALVADPKNGIYYGAILHGSEGMRWQLKTLWSHPYFPEVDSEGSFAPITKLNVTKANAKSLTVFQIDKRAPEKRIIICRNKDCEPEIKIEGGERVYPAKLEISWEKMQPIPGLPSDIVRGYIIQGKKWPKLGEKIAVCKIKPNIIEWIAQKLGQCRSGVSAIFPEEGSQYLLIIFVWSEGKKPSSFSEYARENQAAIISDDIIRFLGEYHADNAVYGILAIKIRK